MKKLKLNVETLKVMSFEVDRGATEAGTVRAHAETDAASCPVTCIGNTCWDSCGYDCNGSGGGDSYDMHSCVYSCGCTNYMTCNQGTCRQCSNIWC